MKIEIKIEDKDFLNSIKFLEEKEQIKIIDNSILIDKKEVSKTRAIINLILRLAKINEDLGRTLSKL